MVWALGRPAPRNTSGLVGSPTTPRYRRHWYSSGPNGLAATRPPHVHRRRRAGQRAYGRTGSRRRPGRYHVPAGRAGDDSAASSSRLASATARSVNSGAANRRPATATVGAGVLEGFGAEDEELQVVVEARRTDRGRRRRAGAGGRSRHSRGRERSARWPLPKRTRRLQPARGGGRDEPATGSVMSSWGSTRSIGSLLKTRTRMHLRLRVDHGSRRVGCRAAWPASPGQSPHGAV